MRAPTEVTESDVMWLFWPDTMTQSRGNPVPDISTPQNGQKHHSEQSPHLPSPPQHQTRQSPPQPQKWGRVVAGSILDAAGILEAAENSAWQGFGGPERRHQLRTRMVQHETVPEDLAQSARNVAFPQLAPTSSSSLALHFPTRTAMGGILPAADDGTPH